MDLFRPCPGRQPLDAWAGWFGTSVTYIGTCFLICFSRLVYTCQSWTVLYTSDVIRNLFYLFISAIIFRINGEYIFVLCGLIWWLYFRDPYYAFSI
jgi:hypothetical protein